jgi:hypothetical protein
MTTATAPGRSTVTSATVELTPAPITEAEIRAALAGPVRYALGNLDEIMNGALAPIMDSDMARMREPDGWDEDFNPQRDDHPGTFWADLTKAETDDLHKIGYEAGYLDQVAESIVAHIVAGTLRWAELHPDAPRGRYQAAIR